MWQIVIIILAFALGYLLGLYHINKTLKKYDESTNTLMKRVHKV